jgi:hypothetical protein
MKNIIRRLVSSAGKWSLVIGAIVGGIGARILSEFVAGDAILNIGMGVGFLFLLMFYSMSDVEKKRGDEVFL